ncbi:MAG: ATP-binding protein [Burkholderiales bacterium]|nr:ATP-binding protein [Burkholderiales bacterium]
MSLTPHRSDFAAPARAGLSLFWRTFFLLGLLLLGSMVAWLQTIRAMESEPRSLQTAQEIASLVNLSRAALVHADAINRVSLINTMTDQEGLHIVPREPGDSVDPFDTDAAGQRVTRELVALLGPGTELANRVNQQEGLWIGFTIDGDSYWLRSERARFNRTGGSTLIIWLMTVTVLSLAGAALITRLINRPLNQLSLAAFQVRQGDFAASTLDESVTTPEILAVNSGFNRMTRKLAEVEHDRAIMLAGISHDLRTPLARLRLETELSVADPEARNHMASDIAQVDAIIEKFLDYARPGRVRLVPVLLRSTIEGKLYPLDQQHDIRVRVDLPDDLMVLAEEVELGRVISNLLENARRYGRSVDTGVAQVEISAWANGPWVTVEVRDHGAGVSFDQLAQLTQPFYRGDLARTDASGTGLGLAIVEKTLSSLGGSSLPLNSAALTY